MIEFFFSSQLTEAIGWTLLHSLWQGVAFAFLLVIMLVALRSYTALTRYVVSIGLFSAFFLTLTTTFYHQFKAANNKMEVITQKISSPTEGDTFVMNTNPSDIQNSNSINYNPNFIVNNITATRNSDWLVEFRAYYTRHLPLLVTLWVFGILFLQLRLLGQLAYIQRLKHYGTKMFPESWDSKIQKLESRIQIRRKVTYLTSICIESPMVIGWLKPVILIPQQLFENLSETEIYTIIAHELAHIRREDFIINLLQTILCNLFFFHPAVWWMSNRIDDEREHCCDDLAVAATGPASTYAKMLITISEHQLKMKNNPSLVMAFAGKNHRRERVGFSARIRRLFHVQNEKGTFREGFATTFILIAALFLGVAATESTLKMEYSNKDSNIGEVEIITPHKIPSSLELQLKNNIEIETQINPVVHTNTSITQNELPISAPEDPRNPESPEISEYEKNTRVDALIMACGEGDLEFVKSLIQLDINVGSIGSNGFTPLMMAVSNQEAETVAYLLSQGADVNQVHSSWTALLEAADEGSLESMKHLLEAGADVNFHQSPGSPTAISMTASEGKLECLQLLLKYGADINGIGLSAPPLHFAAEENKREILDFLISQKVNLNKKDVFGRTALMYAASEGNMASVIKLIKAGADITIIDNHGANAKDHAENEEEYRTRDYLEDQNPSITNSNEVNAWSEFVSDSNEYFSDKNKDSFTRPKIHQATWEGQIEKVQQMVEQGSEINTTDDSGRTPLHIAAAKGYDIDMRVLIGLGANVNAQDHQGRTPLMYASASGKKDAVALLVSRLADVNIKDADNMRAYEWARNTRNSEIAQFLILITNNETKTARKENRANGHDAMARREEQRIEKIVQQEEQQSQKYEQIIQQAVEQTESYSISNERAYLKHYGINKNPYELFEIVRNGTLEDCSKILEKDQSVNTTDDNGQTALMIAARTNRIDIAKLLIEYGADVNTNAASGVTALHFAVFEDNDQMVRLLLKNNAIVDPIMHYYSTDGNDSQKVTVWEYMGATPLLIAVEAKNTKVLSALIEAGANKNQSIIRNEYRLHEDSNTNLTDGEGMGLNRGFLQKGVLQKSNDNWSPYKHAILNNDAAILEIFKNK